MKPNRLCGNRLNVSVALLAALVLCVQGCGGTDGPETYDLSGNVTFDGAPVPAGQIVFEPDSSADNSGPQGFAEIKDGKYDTATGKGTIGGAYLVRITGLAGAQGGAESGAGSETVGSATVLFTDFQTKADLPKDLSTMDFDVTASDVKAQQRKASQVNRGP